VLSAKNWKLESFLRLGFGLLLCLGVGMLLATLVRGATNPNATPTMARMIISALCFHVGAIALAWRFLHEQQTNWTTGFRLNHRSGVAIGIGVLAIALFLPVGGWLQRGSLWVMDNLGIKSAPQLALEAVRNCESFPEIFTLAMIAIVLAPIAVKDHGYPRLALWGTSALFAFIHFNFAIFLPLLLLAVILVWVYERTDNLLAPIAAHATFNAVNFILIFVTDAPAPALPAQP
jgi:membrane protease YdiL (CAAX protease family)